MSKHLAKHASGGKSRKDDFPAEDLSYYDEPESYGPDEPEEAYEEEAYEEAPVYEDEEYDEEDYENARAGKKRKGRKLLVAIIIIVAFVIILAELAYLAFGYFYNKMNFTGSLTQEQRAAAIASYVEVPEDTEEEADPDAYVVPEVEVDSVHAMMQAMLAESGGSLISSEDVVNILLIGTDARDLDENARSDVMMLASLNQKTHKIILTSFMRDVYTYIPDYGYNRLNAPYAIAGADYLIETLETDFGIDIDNYAAVNFYAFADVIDAIGGIDLELTNKEVDFINEQAYQGEQAQLGVGTGAIYLEYSESGMYHLNGTQALAHCRNRSSAGSDFDRTSRQRTVISTLIEKAKTASLTELYNLLDTILPMVSTNLTQVDCLALLIKSPEYLGYEIVNMRVPYENEYTSAMINGMSVLGIDFVYTSQLLQETIYGTPDAAPAEETGEAASVPEPADAAPPAGEAQAEEPAPPAPLEETPAEEVPAEGEAPAEEVPAEGEAPAEEVPAEGEAPAEEVPAEGEAPAEGETPAA